MMVVYKGETAGWEIYDRDGRKLIYGNASNSSTRLVNSANGQVFTWLLERVDDPDLNQISYTYDKTASANLAYLKRIDYGQGSTQNRRVEFVLNNPSTQDRPDKPVNVRPGFRQQTDRRVVTIEVTASSSLVTRYVLTYSQDPDSTRSRLSAVQRYGANGTSSLPPHLFAYSERATGAGFLSTMHTTSVTSADNCGPSGGLHGEPSISGIVQSVDDLNRDGLADIYRYGDQNRFNGVVAAARLGTGTYFRPGPNGCSGLGTVWGGFDMLYRQVYPIGMTDGSIVADFNGDGYVDHMYQRGFPVVSGFNPAKGLRLGGPTGFTEPAIPTSFALPHTWSFQTDINGWDATYLEPGYSIGDPSLSLPQWTLFRLVDMTGDGLLDLVTALSPVDAEWGPPSYWPFEYCSAPGVCDSSWDSWLGWAVFVNRGLKTGASGSYLDFGSAPIKWATPPRVAIERRYLAWTTSTVVDLNGDALADRVSGHSVEYGTGFGFLPAETRDGNYFYEAAAFNGGAQWGLWDLNGDGFLDHVGYNPEGYENWWVFWGDGQAVQNGEEGSVFSVPSPSALNHSIMENDGTQSTPSQLRDVNGDGLPDRIAYGSGVHLNAGPLPGLLIRATDPMGGIAEFDYATVPQMQDAAGLPANPGFSLTKPVVKEVRHFSGRAGATPTTTTYHYAGAVFAYDEKEFRGFGTVTATTVAAGQPSLVVVSYRRTDRTCAFELEDQEIRSNTTVLARESTDFVEVTGGGTGANQWGKCLPSVHLAESVEGSEASKKVARTTWDYGTPINANYNVMKRTEWGEWNPTTQTNVVGDERVTTFTYATATSGWPHVVSRLASKLVEDLNGNDYERERYCYHPSSCSPVAPIAARGRLHRVIGYLTDYTALPTPIIDSQRTLTTITYDVHGNPVTIVGATTTDDPNGLSTTIAYDSTYATFPISSSVGADTASPLTTTIAYTGCATGSVAPPGLGLACTVTEPQLHSTVLGYDTFGRITRLERRGSDTSLVSTETRSYTFPAAGETLLESRQIRPGAGDLVSKSYVDGFGRTYYEESPGKLSETIKVSRTFDERGNLWTETLPYFGASGLARTFAHDVLGRVTAVLDPDSASGGLQRTFTYAPWSVTDDAYFGSAIAANRKERTIRASDGLGRLVTIAQYEDAVAASTPFLVTAKYDPADRLYEVRDPMSNNSALCSGMGSACTTQDHVTEVTWDSFGRRVKIDDPDSGTWIYRYDDAGLLKERTQHPGTGSVRTQAFTYDHWQRLAQKTVTPTSAGTSNATFAYQNNPANPDFGHLIGVDTSDTDYVYGYDVAGRRDAVIQRTSGREFGSVWTFDELDRVKSRLFPDGETFNYAYDGVRLLNIHAAAANSAFTGKVLKVANYDALGRSAWIEIGEGAGSAAVARMSYGYSSAHARLTQVDGVPGNLLANDPDGDGDANSTDRCDYAYDPSNADLGGIGASSSPDGIGNACQCGDVDGSGRITIDDANGSNGIMAFIFGGTMIKPEFCDVTGDGQCEMADYWAVYNAASSGTGSLQNCKPTLASNAPSSTQMNLVVAFDGLGRLTSQSESAGDGGVGRSFTYDSLSRLKTASGPWEKATGESGAVTWTYTYDALGNLRTQTTNRVYWNADNRTWRYDHATKPRALTVFEQQGRPNESLSYTSSGEVSFIDRGPSDPQHTLVWNTIGKLRSHVGSEYTYDAFDDLVKTVSTVASMSTTHIQVGDDFEYDYTNGRAVKHFSVNGVRIATLGTVYTAPNAAIPPALRPVLRFVEPLVAPAAAGLLGLGLVSLLLVATRRRTPGWLAAPGVGVLSVALVGFPYVALAATLPTGGPGTLGRTHEPFVAYLTDHLGTIRATVNKNGIVVETRDYDPWGQTSSRTGVFAVNHRFTGQPQDDAAGGLYNYGARFYSAKWGRFASPDEMVQGFGSQGLNPFTYVLNRPTSATDPTGNFLSIPNLGLSGLGSLNSIGTGLGPVAAPSTSEAGRPLKCDDFGQCILDTPLDASTEINGGEAIATLVTLGELTRVVQTAEAIGAALSSATVWIISVPLFIVGYPGTAHAPTLAASKDDKSEKQTDSEKTPSRGGHRKGARESRREVHEKGEARRKQDQGGEKGDARRPYQR